MSNNGRGKILLKTLHGSRLYGTHKEDSDYDHYTVYESGPAKQTLVEVDGEVRDEYVIGLDSFLDKIQKGTHQAMEALNSPIAYREPSWEPFFRGIKAYSPLIEETYSRTIKKMSYGDAKRRIYAYRLAYNLTDLRRFGRFNPRLTEAQLAERENLIAMNEETFQAKISSILRKVREG